MGSLRNRGQHEIRFIRGMQRAVLKKEASAIMQSIRTEIAKLGDEDEKEDEANEEE